MGEFDQYQVAQASPSRPDYYSHSTSSRPDGHPWSPSMTGGNPPWAHKVTNYSAPCPAEVEMHKEASLALNRKIDAASDLSASERAASKALAELDKDRQQGFEEMKARPKLNTDFSIEHRQAADEAQMAEMLKGKTHLEIDRIIGGANQLLAATPLNLARAGDRVWLGNKDFLNEGVERAARRYTPACLIMGITSGEMCPALYAPSSYRTPRAGFHPSHGG